jgi:hypothetical protein
VGILSDLQKLPKVAFLLGGDITVTYYRRKLKKGWNHSRILRNLGILIFASFGSFHKNRVFRFFYASLKKKLWLTWLKILFRIACL